MEKKGNDINDDATQMVEDGLAWLRLEHEVAAAATARQALHRRQQRMRSAGGLVLLCMAIGLWYFMTDKPRTNQSQPAEKTSPLPAPESTPVIDTLLHSTPTPSEKPLKTTPIAANKSENSPRYDAPLLRGGSSAPDPHRKALLDAIWHTDYPAQSMQLSADFTNADRLLRNREFEEAYVNLQKLERKMPDNDTLRLLKGYCLLEMGEGSAALEYLQPLSSRHQDWQAMLDWHQTMAWLLTGSDDKAMEQLKRISAVSKHPYRSRSQRALQLLSKQK